MSRLHTELQRLYAPQPPAAPGSPAADWAAPTLIDPEGRVRALVLALARPADWDVLGPLWRAVQQTLDWPAPGIAVSGTDALELWFSLAEPVPAAQAHALLQALCRQHLAEVPARRLRLMPQPSHPWPASALPGQPLQAGQWSAFVASDLVPMFADEPWLSLPPSPEGQAELLGKLRSIPAEAWADACTVLLAPPAPPASAAAEAAVAAGSDPVAAARPVGASGQALDPAPAPGQPSGQASASAVPPRLAETGPASPAAGPGPLHTPHTDPRQFLLAVMNDPGVAMALRIEAAKALLAGQAGQA